MKRKINLIEAAMKFPQVPIAITVIMVFAGLISLMTMPRSEDPRVTVRQGLVVAFYPGADEEQIEKEVTDKLEQYLFGFEEIKKEKTHSESKPGQVVVTVELQDYVKDTKKFWNTLQHGLDANMPLALPRGVQGPYVNSDFGDVVVQMIAVSAPGRSYAQLENYLDELEDGIKTIPSVSKIKRYGGQKQQVFITLREDVLKQYGFGINEITNTLSQQNVTIPSGDIEIDKNRFLIFTDAQYQNENEIGNLIVYSSPQGGNIRLRDIANIERRYEDLKSKITVSGNDVMMLTVEMQPGQNIVDLGNALTQKVAEVKEILPFWEGLRHRAGIQTAMAGINAGVVGILVSALYDPVWTSAIHGKADFGLALLSFGLLTVGRVPPALVVLLAGLAGWVMAMGI